MVFRGGNGGVPLQMVHAAADSVVYQVALLPSNNGLRHSEQYYASDHCAPFLHW